MNAANRFEIEPRRPRRSWRSALRALLPADRLLLERLASQAALVTRAGETLVALLSDPSDAEGRVRGIEELEKQGDRVQGELLAQVAAAWLAPFPRPLLLAFVHRMDDVLDLIEDAAQSLHLYHATRVPPEAIRLAVLGVDCSRLLERGVAAWGEAGARAQIVKLTFEVAELEAQADHVMRAAMSRLFREEPDAREIIKLKALYEVLEGYTDQCKHAANALQAMALRA